MQCSSTADVLVVGLEDEHSLRGLVLFPVYILSVLFRVFPLLQDLISQLKRFSLFVEAETDVILSKQFVISGVEG